MTKLKLVGTKYYPQPKKIDPKYLSFKEIKYNDEPAFEVHYKKQKIGMVNKAFREIDRYEGIKNKYALQNAKWYHIYKFKKENWGGYIYVRILPNKAINNSFVNQMKK